MQSYDAIHPVLACEIIKVAFGFVQKREFTQGGRFIGILYRDQSICPFNGCCQCIIKRGPAFASGKRTGV